MTPVKSGRAFSLLNIFHQENDLPEYNGETASRLRTSEPDGNGEKADQGNQG